MTDISTTIAPKSDQLNADDLIAGPRSITVTKVTAAESTPEQPVSIFYEGDNGKPYKPCKSMRRLLVFAWGKDGQQYKGRRMTLFLDPEVKFGGIKVGGIRISHLSHIDGPLSLALTASKGKRAPYNVEPLRESKPQNSMGGKEAAGASPTNGAPADKLELINKAGKQMSMSPDGWKKALCDALTTKPFDMAKETFENNEPFIDAASVTHPDHAAAVKAAWGERLKQQEEI